MYFGKTIVAIIKSLGFWRKTGEEIDKKTGNASLTKTVILFILTVAVSFFYYKTHQVVTFDNEIQVHSVKGNYNTYEIATKHDTSNCIISRDRISSLIIFNCYTNNDFVWGDPQYFEYGLKKKSGVYVSLDLDTGLMASREYQCGWNVTQKSLDSLEFCYEVYFWNNSIPSLFPISVHEEWDSGDEWSNVAYYDDFFANPEGCHGRLLRSSRRKGVDKVFFTSLASSKKCKRYSKSIASNHINHLNFFSAADLSQCLYMCEIKTEIPIDNFKICFDIPIELSNQAISQNRFDSREFSIEIEEDKYGWAHKVVYYHITFPTLANLQLIRSLILTTLLTALLSVFFVNLYYYCRKRYKKHIAKHTINEAQIEKIESFWIPASKIVVWSIILLSAFALFLSIINHPIKINAAKTKIILIWSIAGLLIYIVIVYVFVILYHIYKQKIFVKHTIKKLTVSLNKRRKQRELLHKQNGLEKADRSKVACCEKQCKKEKNKKKRKNKNKKKGKRKK